VLVSGLLPKYAPKTSKWMEAAFLAARICEEEIHRELTVAS
jgi:hypothetical protein